MIDRLLEDQSSKVNSMSLSLKLFYIDDILMYVLSETVYISHKYLSVNVWYTTLVN